ncbi:MAG: hypothetical protein JNG85_01310 [Spirochaetaceae bacterium]|nr:hypothetical protein [Spirochaetaceae bacterium]
MIVTLYKTGKDGRILYYTVHDRQAGLTSPYALTLAWRTGNGRERERLHLFESLAEMDKMIKTTLAKRFKDGYRLLYSWSRDARWSDGAETAFGTGGRSAAPARRSGGSGLLARAEEAQRRLAIG